MIYGYPDAISAFNILPRGVNDRKEKLENSLSRFSPLVMLDLTDRLRFKDQKGLSRYFQKLDKSRAYRARGILPWSGGIEEAQKRENPFSSARLRSSPWSDGFQRAAPAPGRLLVSRSIKRPWNGAHASPGFRGGLKMRWSGTFALWGRAKRPAGTREKIQVYVKEEKCIKYITSIPPEREKERKRELH